MMLKNPEKHRATESTMDFETIMILCNNNIAALVYKTGGWAIIGDGYGYLFATPYNMCLSCKEELFILADDYKQTIDGISQLWHVGNMQTVIKFLNQK